MKNSMFTLAVALVIGVVAAPAPVQAVSCSNPYLTSQAEINSLNSVCPALAGSLTIKESVPNDIVDLKPLRQLDLTAVDGIDVNTNSMLVSLEGLEGIKRASSYVYIGSNASLKTLDGLSGLENVGALIYIEYNDSLESLQGLQSTDGSIEGLWVVGNPKLVNLEGLEEFYDVDEVTIMENQLLLSLKGLEGLRDVSRWIEIYSNYSLTSFCSLFHVLNNDGTVIGGGALDIWGNAIDPTGAEIVYEGACLPDPTDYIGQLLDSGVINDGQLTALLAKLNKCNTNALTNQINAFVNAGIVTQAEADVLVNAANASCM